MVLNLLEHANDRIKDGVIQTILFSFGYTDHYAITNTALEAIHSPDEYIRWLALKRLNDINHELAKITAANVMATSMAMEELINRIAKD